MPDIAVSDGAPLKFTFSEWMSALAIPGVTVAVVDDFKVVWTHGFGVADANTRYAEYLRVLDEVPVLLDVVSEPPRSAIRDFRLGQRPNVRSACHCRRKASTSTKQH